MGEAEARSGSTRAREGTASDENHKQAIQRKAGTFLFLARTEWGKQQTHATIKTGRVNAQWAGRRDQRTKRGCSNRQRQQRGKANVTKLGCSRATHKISRCAGPFPSILGI